MNRVSIGARLSVGFGLMLLFMAILVALSVWRLESSASASEEVIEQRVPVERMVTEWGTLVRENSIRVDAISKLSDPWLSKELEDAIVVADETILQIQEKLKSGIQDLHAHELFEAAQQKHVEYGQARDEAAQAQFAGNYDRASQLYDQELPKLRTDYMQGIAALIAYQQDLSNDRGATLKADNNTALMIIAGVGAIALVLGLIFALTITRSITRPLYRAVDYAKAVANRDLTRRIEIEGRDETSQLLSALQQMNTNLLGVIGRVQEGADSIASASGQIAAGNTDLSSRTEEQASSLAETAATMEELTTTVKQNAENADTANQLAKTASSVAVNSGGIVAKVVDTMGAIDSSAKQVVEIISVIDSIAFQTNILALNASVEAARAGEQGRGFAVVASEVRALAQRSAAAAKEIKALIDTSVQSTDEGNKLASQAGLAMQETVDSIARVVNLMSEIAAASNEQSVGIEQVNQAVGQMDQATQQNAALVEEASVASGSMQDQAHELARLAATFKISSTSDPLVIDDEETRYVSEPPLALA